MASLIVSLVYTLEGNQLYKVIICNSSAPKRGIGHRYFVQIKVKGYCKTNVLNENEKTTYYLHLLRIDSFHLN